MLTVLARVSIGEWLVTGSGILLAAATFLLWQLTRIADKDMRDNTEAVRRANELSLRSLEHVAMNANDDMAGVAATAITHSAPPTGHVHVRRIARLYHPLGGDKA